MSRSHALRDCFAQFLTHPLRTALTLLGMVIGVAALVAMMSIGAGAQSEILAAIDSMGATVVHVRATAVEEESLSEIVDDSVGLSRSDVREIERLLPGVRALAYRLEQPLHATDLPLQPQECPLFAVSPSLFDVHGLRVAQGRGLHPLDHEEARKVVVIGAGLAERAFGGRALGRRIRLEYSFFEVVGVLEQARSAGGAMPVDLGVYNSAVLVPYNTALETIRPAPVYDEIDLISVEVASTGDTLGTKAVLGPLLQQLHGGLTDVEIVAPEEILRQRSRTQRLLNTVLTAIAALSLLVGGIGVMNTMLASVLERVPEIGLRRSLGARRRQIRNQFLIEATLMCAAGGSVGVVLGLTLSLSMSLLTGVPAAFVPSSIALSIGVSTAVGLGFGAYPAARAARTEPIVALRGGF